MRILMIVVVLATLLGVTLVAQLATPPSWLPPSEDDARTSLADLSFEGFVGQTYRIHLLRHPQLIAEYGVCEELGVRNDRLNNYSESFTMETQRIERLILAQLRAFDRDALSLSEQLTYDVCEWFWEDRVLGHPFENHGYPLNQRIHSWDRLLLALTTD